MKPLQFLFLFSFILLFSATASAQLGYDNPNLPRIEVDIINVTNGGGGAGNVSSVTSGDNYLIFNPTVGDVIGTLNTSGLCLADGTNCQNLSGDFILQNGDNITGEYNIDDATFVYNDLVSQPVFEFTEEVGSLGSIFALKDSFDAGLGTIISLGGNGLFSEGVLQAKNGYFVTSHGIEGAYAESGFILANGGKIAPWHSTSGSWSNNFFINSVVEGVLNIRYNDVVFNNSNVNITGGDLRVNGSLVCLEDGTNCMSSGDVNLTNVAFVNESNVFQLNQDFSENITVGGQIFIGHTNNVSTLNFANNNDGFNVLQYLSDIPTFLFDDSLAILGDLNVFNNVTIGGWYNGLFNWTTSSLSNYLLPSFDGTNLELDFNETLLNQTIESLEKDRVIISGTVRNDPGSGVFLTFAGLPMTQDKGFTATSDGCIESFSLATSVTGQTMFMTISDTLSVEVFVNGVSVMDESALLIFSNGDNNYYGDNPGTDCFNPGDNISIRLSRDGSTLTFSQTFVNLELSYE